MQNVHTRGNIHGNLPLFGQIAGFLPYLDKARGICYIFHRFRYEAGCADRSPCSPSFIYRCAYAAVQRKATGGLCALPSYFCCYRHHEGVCRWLVSRADPFFVWPKEEAFYENEPPFHHPQPRAGCTVPCTGLCAAHDHRPCAAGGQHAVPDALSHSAVRLCAGRPMGPCRGLHCSAGAVGAVRHAADVPHRHCHGL